MSAVADKLREARALIERGWTQKAYAKDAHGLSLFWFEPGAVCWCAIGAIRAVDSKHDNLLIEAVEEAIGPNLFYFNDAPGRTQAEVLAAFDKAIELAEVQQ